ncbi:hypothetical protein N7476_005046 [Penicillium atrosanguineum]|uniref:F-box domain-containing protein n=1 Tax=Penicillium atrosanguineum TaxID=1132637 RepID=A0A9W9U657_9EURO|nr:hypothetical protein N7476_005046 [Penicillium atrosanguineum]
MSILLRLPNELLLLICQKLESIDAYELLARTCKSLRSAIYDDLNVRRLIYKSIILTAPHHKYDIEICHIEGIQSCKTLAKPILHDETANALTCGGFHASLDESPNSQSLGEDDFMVRLIWNRWHQMKELYTMYLDPGISEAYQDCPMILAPSCVQETVSLSRDLAGRKRTIHNPGTGDWKQAHQEYYHRFYLALTTHWRGLALYDIAQSLMLVVRGSEHSACYDTARAIFCQEINQTLDDLVDIVDVVEFVWGFLGYTILGCPENKQFPLLTERFLNLTINIAYLQPPDFLELFQQYGRMSDRERQVYVEDASSRAIGRKDRGFGYHSKIEVGVIECLASYSTLDDSSLDQRLKNERKEKCTKKWVGFRATWSLKVKGRVLQEEVSFEGSCLYDEIMKDE